MASHPGRILKSELDERNIKQKEFATTLGMQPSHLNAALATILPTNYRMHSGSPPSFGSTFRPSTNTTPKLSNNATLRNSKPTTN